MNEEWKDIEGYENLYQISNVGQVLSMRRSMIMKGGICTSGYRRIGLSKNGVRVQYSNHRLVASHFLGKPKEGEVVHHKDGDKLNNDVDNLEWCSHWDHLERHYQEDRYTETLSIRTTKELKERVKKEAKAEGRTVSNYLNRLIEGALRNPIINK